MKKLLLIFVLFPAAGFTQTIASNWKGALNSELEQFKSCNQKMVNGINPCNRFIGQVLSTVYQVNDFYAAEQGRNMLLSEIAAYLQTSQDWKLLGYGFDQQALYKAQETANAGKAVVALYLNEQEIGLLSFVLPGELYPSGIWGLKVPNSATFFIHEPERSYVGKGLSYSFERRHLTAVLLYARN